MSSDSRGRRIARAAAMGGGVLGVAGLVTAGILFGQAEIARRTIPLAEAPPPRVDGRYGQRFDGRPVRLAVLGDSSAAGYGVRRARQTPGALIATGISRRLGRPVELRSYAVVGCTSARLWPQVEAAIELEPDLAVILVGANDLTHADSRGAAVRYLADAVRALRAAGTEVVVGTCPDLGAVQPIRPPLRWLARHWSRQLAAAQTVAVVEAGGWTVSLGDLLGPRFSAEPLRFFGGDRYHPSAEGYAAASAALLPTALAALGAREVTPVDPASDGVRSLPRAAAVAARRAGTEVSGAQIAGRERGPAGRWARLRNRMRWHEARDVMGEA